MRLYTSIYKGSVEINCTCGHEYIFNLPQKEREYEENYIVVDRIHKEETFYTICDQCETGYKITISIESFNSVANW